MIIASASSLLSTLRLAALAPMLSLAAPADLSAQTPGAVYERRHECIQAAVLSAEQCEFAYRNARAEFEQKAPRYASRVLCERSHKRCGAQMVSNAGWDSFGKGGATYVPRFTGVRITGEGTARRAWPVIEGAGRIPFAGRPVTELQDKVAGRQGTVGLAASRGGHGHAAQQSSGPYVKRGDRDDTVRVPMQQKAIGSDVAPGLYVDPDGVEWYKPARR
ncbi:DUF1190 domain-containing protein [Bosea vaviloviae]|uniref:DUF1190 domain-containing protein n=1 Tax=Bosea vaviloviae TaxID=1526658 RepID=A0A0N0M8R5_9HYPH|nr:DUF1190 domain-containing protein [Bosea vaviloviae]KPH75519.1 hypothetical protein AE618_24405 [Bosea vaviloviae]